MYIESGILSKPCCLIYAKMLHTDSFEQFTKTLNQFFYLTSAN